MRKAITSRVIKERWVSTGSKLVNLMVDERWFVRCKDEIDCG